MGPVAFGAALALWVTLSQPAMAGARELRVGQDAPTAQATIDLAVDGDVVIVTEGTWAGPVDVNKRITLRGDGGVLDGGGEGTVLTVSAPRAIVEHLTVQGSGEDLGAPHCCVYVAESAEAAEIRDNLVRDCAFGIWIHRADHSKVIDNRVVGRADLRSADRGNGIHLFDADHMEVLRNRVRDGRDGIYVSATDDSLIADNVTNHQRYGIHYMYSYRNTLRGNESSHNTGGIALMQSRELIVESNVAEHNERIGILFRDAQECAIRHNRLVGNGQGMFFFSSTDNVIEHNLLERNEVGAKIWAGSLRNRVSGNSFVANRQQVFYVGSEDLIWGDEAPGNFYSDYLGWDQDGDGLGDRPHRIDSFTANLLYKHPGAVLLLRSPALELLSHLERSMPLLRVPTVVDARPSMQGWTS